MGPPTGIAKVTDEHDRIRIDKWLWAARFYKTRALAADAVDGGKVQVNGERVKPAKALRAGDSLAIRNGHFVWQVTVLLLSERRGSATEASRLYCESDQSRSEREEKTALLRIERQSNPFAQGRPTKRARRQIIKFVREQD